MPLGRVVCDKNVNILRYGVGPRVVRSRILKGMVFSTAFGNLWCTVNLQLAISREGQGDRTVLEVDDLAPVEVPCLFVALVVRASTAWIKIAIVVAGDDYNVAVAIRGAIPWFLQCLEPIDASLYFRQGAVVRQISRMEQQVAFGQCRRGYLRVRVRDADHVDRNRIWWGTVGHTTKCEEDMVQKAD